MEAAENGHDAGAGQIRGAVLRAKAGPAADEAGRGRVKSIIRVAQCLSMGNAARKGGRAAQGAGKARRPKG